MEYQCLFSDKNKKTISKFRLLYFLPSMLSVKGLFTNKDVQFTLLFWDSVSAS